VQRDERPAPQALLAELGLAPRLTVYLAGAPGAGKTRRLLTDAALQAAAGRRVALGWIETKGRPDLDALAAPLPRIPSRRFVTDHGSIEDFDLEAALASDAEMVVLDELAHTNPHGAPNAKRWQDALALRRAGRSVLGAFNIQHLETVAPTAERIVGYPIRELVPLSFLKEADSVVALDVSADVLESRLRTGRIVHDADVERAASGVFRPQNLALMRELLLRTIDDLTVPVLSPSKVSTALAIVTPHIDASAFLQRVAALADALDLAVESAAVDGVDAPAFAQAALGADASRIALPEGILRGRLDAAMATVVAVPNGELAQRMLRWPLDRMLYVADPERPVIARTLDGRRHPYGHAVGDRLRIGYGKLTIFIGAAAGSGKTYAMLDRAHQLLDDGVSVVAGLIETHGRADTAAKAAGIETLPRRPDGELDVAALILLRPQVALVDELAHTNAGGNPHDKRYADVIELLRAGIDVMTTLNVQHLESAGEAVERLTGTRVRETLPDSVLDLADEIVFIDVAPEMLRERLRTGKIYPPERVDAALTHFFRLDRLTALRELAIREVAHALRRRRAMLPFDRILLGVAPRARDADLIERMGRLASRLDVDLHVVTIVPEGAAQADLDRLEQVARRMHGTFSVERGTDAPQRLLALAQRSDVVAVESPRRARRLFSQPSFASRLMGAGARELLVLRPANA
jgi:two-component system sensor histidine kinase KdpD